MYISKNNDNDCMDLLLIHSDEVDEDTYENKNQYVHIKDFNRFMFNKTKCKNKKYFCKSCLHCFSCEIVLDNHKSVCLSINGEQAVKLSDGSTSFTNYSGQIAVLFNIYADFECILEKCSDEQGEGVERAKRATSITNTSSTIKYQNQVPCGFSYELVCVDDRFSKDVAMHRAGVDDIVDNEERRKKSVHKFITAMLDEYEYCKKIKHRYFNQNLVMSKKDEKKFQSADKWWVCKKMFDENSIHVRDHCHITGKFRSASNQDCNINLKITNRVQVILHNIHGYDSHLIIKELGNFDVDVTVIPNGLEKYMTFIINKNLIFIDSMQFLNSSLDSLVKTLNDSDFKELSKEFKDDLQLELVKQKGVYPYEYMDSFDKFNDCQLPIKKRFYSTLKGAGINDEDYERAKKVWNAFDMKNMVNYHDLYLKTDVLLLCDVFETFIDMCMHYYGLDPCHYFSALGLSWDEMLKMTGVVLEHISDIDMNLFIEKGMIGGVSYIGKRYAKANNKYVEGYDATAGDSYIMYFDANNLYG